MPSFAGATGVARGLPAVVREGLVRLRHAEDVVLPLVGAALLGLGVHELARQALRHRLLAARAGELDQPAHGERARSALRHLDGHLVGRAADAAGADLEHGGDLLDRLLERRDRVLARALGEDLERLVDDLLGRGLLAVHHDLVDELLDELRPVHRIGLDRADSCGGAARHRYLAFAPYWERAFLRSDTPAASSVPRTT